MLIMLSKIHCVTRKKRHELNWCHSKGLLMAIQKNIGFVYLGFCLFFIISIKFDKFPETDIAAITKINGNWGQE